MNDRETTVEQLKQQVLAFMTERDWQQFHTPKNLSMGLATEAAELMEHFLWIKSEDFSLLQNPAKREKICEELADILIYALEFSNITQVDLAAAVAGKLEKNARKYPVAKAKGKALKYDEL